MLLDGPSVAIDHSRPNRPKKKPSEIQQADCDKEGGNPKVVAAAIMWLG